jgi:hypothetical protein
MPQADQYRRGRAVSAVAAAVLGGAVGWTLFYVGLNLWGLAIGVSVVAGGTVAGVRARGSQRSSESLALSFAWSLLSWPLIWVLAVLIRYWITGKSVGS